MGCPVRAVEDRQSDGRIRRRRCRLAIGMQQQSERRHGCSQLLKTATDSWRFRFVGAERESDQRGDRDSYIVETARSRWSSASIHGLVSPTAKDRGAYPHAMSAGATYVGCPQPWEASKCAPIIRHDPCRDYTLRPCRWSVALSWRA